MRKNKRVKQEIDLTNFVPIPGFTGYLIDTSSNIYSHHTHRLLTHNLGGRKRSQYFNVRLVKQRGEQAGCQSVHVLMAITFLGHVPGGNIIVDHISNNKLNNNLSNIQLVTQQYNLNKDRVNSRLTTEELENMRLNQTFS